jgi:hypothetical protein
MKVPKTNSLEETLKFIHELIEENPKDVDAGTILALFARPLLEKVGWTISPDQVKKPPADERRILIELEKTGDHPVFLLIFPHPKSNFDIVEEITEYTQYPGVHTHLEERQMVPEKSWIIVTDGINWATAYHHTAEDCNDLPQDQNGGDCFYDKQPHLQILGTYNEDTGYELEDFIQLFTREHYEDGTLYNSLSDKTNLDAVLITLAGICSINQPKALYRLIHSENIFLDPREIPDALRGLRKYFVENKKREESEKETQAATAGESLADEG